LDKLGRSIDMPLLKTIFTIAQELPPPVDTETPPTTTTPPTITYPPSYNPNEVGDIGTVIMVCIAVFIGLFLLWSWNERRQRVRLEDIRPSVDNLSSKEVSLNRAAFMQMLPYMPPLIGITPVLLMVEESPALALATLIALISMPSMLYMYMKNKSLEMNKGKINMNGYGRKVDGSRFAYNWRNVEFIEERHMNEDELRLIDEAKILKATSIPSLARAMPEVESDEKLLQEQLTEVGEGATIEYSKEVWKREDFKNIHTIPIGIDNRHDAYLLSKFLPSEWDLILGEDFDYYGYHDVRVTGPELREMGTVHRVSQLDNGEYRDMYIPVFLVVFDDKMSSDLLEGMPPVDVTRDDAIAGLTKAIAVDERTAAGELNSITEQVMILENQDKDVDDLSQTIGRKLANDYTTAEKRLTLFDVGMLGTVSTLVAIAFAVLAFLLGLSIGGNG